MTNTVNKFTGVFLIALAICITACSGGPKKEADNVNKRDELGRTPLMVEAGLGNLQKVQELLNQGADLFTTDVITGAAPLHFAVQSGNVEVVKLLVEKGAQVNQQVASHGMTPLMLSIWHRNPEVAAYLLSLPNININIKGTGGGDAYGMAFGTRKSGQTTPELPPDGMKMFNSLKDYTNTYITDKLSHQLITAVLDKSLTDIRRATVITALLDQGANVNYRQPNIQTNNDSHTALLIASREGYDNTVKVLLDGGADITVTGELMKAHPAHKAAYRGYPKVMELLIAHPDFHKIKDLQGPFNGYTALHDAVWHGSYETAKQLVDAGANVNLKGWDGNTALDLARKYNYTDIIALLEPVTGEKTAQQQTPAAQSPAGNEPETEITPAEPENPPAEQPAEPALTPEQEEGN